MVIKLFLILMKCSYIYCNLRLGPFGIYDEPVPSHSSVVPLITTGYSTYIETVTTVKPEFATSIVHYDNSSNFPYGFQILREIVAPMLTILGFLPSTIYFSFKLFRLIRLHYKYRRFRFIRRPKPERDAIRSSDIIIQMDPLKKRETIL